MASGGYAAGEVAQPAEKNGPLQLHVKFLDGTSFDLATDSAQTLGDVQEKIQELHGILPEQQALLLGRKRLADSSSTLAALQIPDKARLTLLKLVDDKSTPPLLRKFWEQWFGILMTQITNTALEVESDSDTDEEGMDKTGEEMKSLVRRAFECHDTNGDGVLDEGEAAVFFLHIVEELSYTMKCFSSTALPILNFMPFIEVKLKLWLLGAADCPESSPDLIADEIRGQANLLLDEIGHKVPKPTKNEFLAQKDARMKHIVNKLVPKAQRLRTSSTTRLAEKRDKFEKRLLTLSVLEKAFADEIDKKLEEYTANKEERDALAFAFLDKNGDGTLAISDVLDALVPGQGENDENDKFFTALGIDKVVGVLEMLAVA